MNRPTDLRNCLARQNLRLGSSVGSSALWGPIHAHQHPLPIERLALPGEAAAARDRRDRWIAAYAPETPGQYSEIEQAVAATLEIDRCRKVRATIQAAKVRTALQQFAHDQEDRVTRQWQRFNTDARTARESLLRWAPGVRWMITRWRELEVELDKSGTWFGYYRHSAVLLQGLSSIFRDHYFSEPAYLTSLHCMALQPYITQHDIDQITNESTVPKHLTDQRAKLWKPDPEDSRCYLFCLLQRELELLVPLEERLRVTYEEPERAEAVEQALARVSKEESVLLRDLRSHEAALRQAKNSLEARRERKERRRAS